MVKTRLDTLSFELRLAIHEMARPICLVCQEKYKSPKKYNNYIAKYCKCDICEGCLIALFCEKTGCVLRWKGDNGSFLCPRDHTISVELKYDIK